MSCCKPCVADASKSPRRRGLSLLEVMVSQTIALVILTAMMSLMVAMISRMQAETATADAQVRLRQVTHLLLRDTQGVGAGGGAGGDIVFIADGGTGAADTFTIFKRDESVCGGELAATNVANFANTEIPLNQVAGVCPFATTGCPAAEVAQRSVQIIGNGRILSVPAPTGSTCKITLPATGTVADASRAAYNTRYGLTAGDMKTVLTQMQPTQVLFGSNFTYRVNASNLERSTDGGATFQVVLSNVLDLQVIRIYVLANGTVVPVSASTGVALPAGVTAADFVGLRIGVITFSKTQDGLVVRPPAVFGNRNHVGTAGIRYRSSFIFAASRNS